MTIQKKSLISSLNTTKKAIVASTPAGPGVQLAKKANVLTAKAFSKKANVLTAKAFSKKANVLTAKAFSKRAR
jgi:hypothetical protein